MRTIDSDDDERSPMPAPHLLVSRSTAAPRAAVLVLHGGQENSHAPVRRWHPAVIRMIPFVRELRRAGGRHLVVARLVHSVRGWNDTEQSPVPEARDALAQLRASLPGLPIGLVGHSMGGRTAMRVAGEANVTSVVGLAPWLPAGEPTRQLAGRRVLVVHGSADRTTSPRASRAYVEALAGLAGSASFIEVRGAGHSLLRRYGLWERLAAGFCLDTLLPGGSGAPDGGGPDAAHRRTEKGPVPNLLRRVREADPFLSV